MKNFIRTLLFTAATMLVFSACTKDPSIDSPIEQPKKISLRILPVDETDSTPEKSKADTRTEFGEQYMIKWLDSDEIGVYTNSTDPTKNSLGLVDRDGATQVVSFLTEVKSFLANDALYAYYPYSASNDSNNSNQITLSIPASQTQEAVGKFNGSHNPLIGNPQKFASGSADDIVSQQIKFYSLGAMTEVGLSTTTSEYHTEVIQSLSFTNTSAENITGTFPYDITSTAGAVLSTPVNKSKLTNASTSVIVSLPEASTATLSATPADSYLYMTLIPGTYTGDFTLVTDKATYTLQGKTIEFERAFVKRLTFNLDKAVRTARIEGAAKWEATSGDLSENASTPKPFVTLGQPALTWAQTTTNPYFNWDAVKGIQIGSGSQKATEILTTNGYGDEIQAIIINASIANSGDATLSVYLDNKLTQTVALTTTPTDHTFTPTALARSITSVKASEIRIEMKSNVQKAMYLKSITIIPANMVVAPLEAPALTVDKTVINWIAVNGATGYEYTTDGGTTPVAITSGTSLDCTAWTPETYSIQVRALGDKVLNSDSEWSTAASVTIEAPVEGEAYELLTDASALSVGDMVIITSGITGTVKAISITQNENNRSEADVTIAASGKITAIPVAVQVLEVKAGTKPNTYSFYDEAKTGYLHAVSNSSNNMQTLPTLNDNGSWTINITANKATIKAQGDASRNWLRHNSTSKLFSCYASGQADVYIFYKSDPTPRIVVADADKTQNFAYDATSGSIPFAAKNITEGVTATVTNAENNWFSITAGANKIDWATTVNAGAARTATLTLSANGAESVDISVTQAAAPQQLAAPAGLTATADGAKVSASWTAVANASSYAWRIATGGSDVENGATSNTSVDITGLSASTTYTLYVKAVGDDIAYLTSPESQTEVTTAAIPQLEMSELTIDAAATTAASLTAQWTAVANATGYKYKVTKTSDGTEVMAETAVTGTSVAVTGLNPETAYTISVKAVGNGADYVDSNYASVNGTTAAGSAASWHAENWAPLNQSTSSYGPGTIAGTLGSWNYTGCSGFDMTKFTTQKGLSMGQTSDKSSITSPKFAGGISGIKFNYFVNNAARPIVVTIYENGSVVDTQTITPTAANQLLPAEVTVSTTSETYFTFTPGNTSRRASVGDIQVMY